MKVNTDRVLMSDTLRGMLPEIDEEIELAKKKHVIVVGQMLIGPKSQGVTGILRGVLFGASPEIEIRMQLDEALNIIQSPDVSFGKFELHHDERIVDMPGPFLILAARIDEISVSDQMCTLGLHLKKRS